MSEPSTNTAEPREASYDPLQPPFCINCGYSLVGLQPECICPECAHPHKASDITIKGWAIGRRRNLFNTRMKSIEKKSLPLIILLLVLAALYSIIFNNYGVLAGGLGGLSSNLIYYYFFYSKDKPPVAVILTTDGMLQKKYGKMGVDPLIDWKDKYLHQLDKNKDGFFVLHICMKNEHYLTLSAKQLNPVAIEFQASPQTIAAIRALVDQVCDTPWASISIPESK